MRKLLCILFALTILCSVGLGEEDAQKLLCAHQFHLSPSLLPEHEWCIEALEVPMDAVVSARCALCDAEGIVFTERSLIAPDPCDEANCTHRMYRLADFDRTEWREVNEQVHQRIKYGVCICVDCGAFGTLIEKLEESLHQMEEKPGFHIDGQYIHVTCEECLRCGMMIGDLVPCIAYEDGICDRTK